MKVRYLGFMFLLSWIGCKYESTVPNIPTVSTNCSPDTVYFKQTIQPLLNSSCGSSGCHDAQSAAEEVIMTDYNNIFKEVVKGNPSKSKLYKVITEDNAKDRMPPAAPLSTSQINAIYTWISQGAKNNSCNDTTCNTTNISYSNDIQPTLSTYCNGCHGSNTYQSNGGGVNLSAYDKVKVYVNNGKLSGSVEQLSGYSPMPKGGILPTCKINQIKSWITDGALNN